MSYEQKPCYHTHADISSTQLKRDLAADWQRLSQLSCGHC